MARFKLVLFLVTKPLYATAALHPTSQNTNITSADRVRAHIFLCMLAYYVEWHMREAWRELLFADTEQQARATRDPVAPAKRSQAALTKAAPHTIEDDPGIQLSHIT